MASPDLHCYSLREAWSGKRPKYKKLVLVSLRQHIEAYGDDDGVLFLSSNWLLWQECLNRGMHCVCLDRGLLDWPEAYTLGNELYLRANDWIYLDGKDITKFHGVSLGTKLNNELTLLLSDVEKLSRAISIIAEEFSSDEIIYYDVVSDYGFLSPSERKDLVRTVAENIGVGFSDRADPIADREPGMTHIAQVPESRSPSVRRKIASFFRMSLDRLFRTIVSLIGHPTRLFSRRYPKVLIAVTRLNGLPLLNSFSSRYKLRPYYLTAWIPNKRNFSRLFSYIISGISFVDACNTPLVATELDDIAKIKRTVTERFKTSPIPLNDNIARYVIEKIVNTGKFEDAASIVKWCERLLDTHQPDMILTDGFRNALTTSLLEIGKAKGLSTLACWHAQIGQYLKLHTLGCDPRTPSSIDICLSWGSAQDQWLQKIGSSTLAVRTGSLVSGKKRNRRPSTNHSTKRRALVLQYFMNYSDYRTPPTYEYEVFVKVVRMLNSQGIDDVIVKLHPGAPKESYYQKISREFRLKCVIFRSENLSELIDEADFAIGQPASGSMMECISAGLPFYPLLLPPNSVTSVFAESGAVFTNFQELEAAVANTAHPNLEDIFNAFTSAQDIPDPTMETWRSLTEKATLL